MITDLNTPAWTKRTDINCNAPAGSTPQEQRHHADQWFPRPTAEDAARSLCIGCPARTECLDYALELSRTEPLEGVWGGTTTIDRLRILGRSIRRASKNTEAVA